MHTQTEDTITSQFKSLSRGKRLVLIVFLIWAAQAVPKWTLAITADGELSAKIVGIFITPKYQELAHNNRSNEKMTYPSG